MSSSNIVDFESPETGAAMRPGREKFKHMRSDLVEKASEVIPDPPVLINMVSRRVRQLNMGRQPLVPIMGRLGTADIALMEIIEGKVAMDEPEEEEGKPAKKKAAKKKATKAKK